MLRPGLGLEASCHLPSLQEGRAVSWCFNLGVSLSQACQDTAELLSFAGWFHCSAHTNGESPLKNNDIFKRKIPLSHSQHVHQYFLCCFWVMLN